MTASRFPCFECAAPFDDVEARDLHQRTEGHGFAQVQLDAIDRARWSIMGDDAPPPESAYGGTIKDLADATEDPGVDRWVTNSHALLRRRRLRVIQGGRR